MLVWKSYVEHSRETTNTLKFLCAYWGHSGGRHSLYICFLFHSNCVYNIIVAHLNKQTVRGNIWMHSAINVYIFRCEQSISVSLATTNHGIYVCIKHSGTLIRGLAIPLPENMSPPCFEMFSVPRVFRCLCSDTKWVSFLHCTYSKSRRKTS